MLQYHTDETAQISLTQLSINYLNEKKKSLGKQLVMMAVFIPAIKKL